MRFHEALPPEAAAIAAFLRRHLDDAMFPLANLTHHGMGRAGRYQMRFWVEGQGAGIEAVVGLSAMGTLLPVTPGRVAMDLMGLREVFAQESVGGIVGSPAWATALLSVLAISQAEIEHMADEPGYSLDLAELILPDDPSLTLRRAEAEDRPLLIHWRAHYRGEVMGTPPDRREAAAAEDIDTYLARDSHRVLVTNAQPLAMTGFNAVLREAVQVGGVYTPPSLRGRGFARAAVALHLAEARARGVPRARLFAANAAAARAYQAIGFRPSGRTMMILFRDGTRIAA